MTDCEAEAIDPQAKLKQHGELARTTRELQTTNRKPTDPNEITLNLTEIDEIDNNIFITLSPPPSNSS